MAEPRPVVITQVAAESYTGQYSPEPLLAVGPIPGAEGGVVDSVEAGTGIAVDATDPAAPEVSVVPAAFVAVDDTPADAAAVAADLIAVRDALIAAGFMDAS
jgi:hypothetical protein